MLRTGRCARGPEFGAAHRGWGDGQPLPKQVRTPDEGIGGPDRAQREAVWKNEEAVRLRSVPGIGPVPLQYSTGGKPRLRRTSKMGQNDLGRLLTIGAMPMTMPAMRSGSPGSADA